MPGLMSNPEATSTRIFWGIIALIVLGIIYYLMSSSSELFESNGKSVEVPPIYDRLTGSIVTGGEFLGVPEKIDPAWGATYGEVDKLDDGNNGMYGLNYAMCSKACCSPQYPPPFEVDKDVVTDKMKGEFVPSQYMCNNAWQDSGCVCMTKNENNFLSSRGGNCTKQ